MTNKPFRMVHLKTYANAAPLVVLFTARDCSCVFRAYSENMVYVPHAAPAVIGDISFPIAGGAAAGCATLAFGSEVGSLAIGSTNFALVRPIVHGELMHLSEGQIIYSPVQNWAGILHVKGHFVATNPNAIRVLPGSDSRYLVGLAQLAEQVPPAIQPFWLSLLATNNVHNWTVQGFRSQHSIGNTTGNH